MTMFKVICVVIKIAVIIIKKLFGNNDFIYVENNSTKNALSGNRTRASRLAGDNSITEQMVLNEIGLWCL